MSKKWMKGGCFKWGSPLLWLLIPPLLVSCAGLSPPRESRSAGLLVLEGVPFYPQEMYQCGPASLAGVLNFWGLRVSPAEIAAAIYSPGAGGTLDVDMVFYAEKKGLKANQYRGSVEDVKENIDSKIPLIVLVDEGFWVYRKDHFMVVVGYEEEGFIVNSGKNRHQLIAFTNFLKSWEKTNFWTLRITPR